MDEVERNVAELSRRAYDVMVWSFSPGPVGLTPSFRLWRLPPDDPQLSWIVFQCCTKTSKRVVPRVRRLLWDRKADVERLHLSTRRKPSLAPHISVAEANLDEAVLERFLERFTGLRIPRRQVGPPYRTEQPGEFGLDCYDMHNTLPILRMEWGRAIRSDLKLLANWARDVRNWLSGVLP